MAIKVIRSLAILMFCVAANANAEVEPYVGGQYSYIEYDDILASEHTTFNSLFARLGAHINEAISAELRVGVGANDGHVAGNADLQLKSAVGIYIRGGVQAADWIYPYIIAGWTRVKFERTEFSGGTSVASDADISSGVGVDFTLAKGFKLNLEYMYYFDNSETEFEAASLGFTQSF